MKHENISGILNKIRIIALKAITVLMLIVFVLSICCLDSEKFYIPTITCFISGGWIFLMAWANGWTY